VSQVHKDKKTGIENVERQSQRSHPVATLVFGGVALMGMLVAAAFATSQPPWILVVLVVCACCLAGICVVWVYSHSMRRPGRSLELRGAEEHSTAASHELERKVDDLSKRLEEEMELANQRLRAAQHYIQNLAKSLGLPPEDRERFERAARESLRAGRDLATHETASEIVRTAESMLGTEAVVSLEHLDELISSVEVDRYSKLFKIHDELTAKDFRPVELHGAISKAAIALRLKERLRLTIPVGEIFALAPTAVVDAVLAESMRNARDYSVPETTIEVVVRRAGEDVVVAFTNELPLGAMVSQDWFSYGRRGPDSKRLYPSGSGQGLPLILNLMSGLRGSAVLEGEMQHCRLVLTFKSGAPLS